MSSCCRRMLLRSRRSTHLLGRTCDFGRVRGTCILYVQTGSNGWEAAGGASLVNNGQGGGSTAEALQRRINAGGNDYSWRDRTPRGCRRTLWRRCHSCVHPLPLLAERTALPRVIPSLHQQLPMPSMQLRPQHWKHSHFSEDIVWLQRVSITVISQPVHQANGCCRSAHAKTPKAEAEGRHMLPGRRPTVVITSLLRNSHPCTQKRMSCKIAAQRFPC